MSIQTFFLSLLLIAGQMHLLQAQITSSIRFENQEADLRLYGELTEPNTDYHTIIMLVSDTGKDKRDIEPALTDSLLEAGFAVFRHDERGVGKSKGRFDEATTLDFAKDLSAAIAWFRATDAYSGKQIVLLGLGEGGTSALLSTTLPVAPDRLVLIGTPAMSGELVLFAQTETILHQQLRLGSGDPQETRTHLIKIHRDLQEDAPEAEIEKWVEDYIAEKKLNADPKYFLNPHYRFYVSFDPTELLRTLRVQSLFLYGSLDIYIQSEQNSRRLWKTGNPWIRYETLENLDHHLRSARSGEHMAPKAIRYIIEYLNDSDS